MEAVPEGAQLGGLGQLCPPPGGAAGGKLKPWSPPEPVPAPWGSGQAPKKPPEAARGAGRGRAGGEGGKPLPALLAAPPRSRKQAAATSKTLPGQKKNTENKEKNQGK